MTSCQCLAKADEVDRLGYDCLTQDGREAFAELGKGWRRNAIIALQHEAWATARQDRSFLRRITADSRPALSEP